MIALFFRCGYANGTPAPTDEAADVAWLTPHQTSQRMQPMFAMRVGDALDLPADRAPVRTHDGMRLLSR